MLNLEATYNYFLSTMLSEVEINKLMRYNFTFLSRIESIVLERTCCKYGNSKIIGAVFKVVMLENMYKDGVQDSLNGYLNLSREGFKLLTRFLTKEEESAFNMELNNFINEFEIEQYGKEATISRSRKVQNETK